MSDSTKEAAQKREVRNLAEPLKLTGVEVDGVAAEAMRAGQTGKIWVRLAITSDDPPFHRIVESFEGVIAHHLKGSRLSTANHVLLVIHDDKTADLWLDSAAVMIRVLMKRAVSAGQAIFESDIGDITHLDFPDVSLKPTDRIFYLFRKDWRFGLYFDLRGKQLDQEQVARDLGSLYRGIAYRHLYDLSANAELSSRLAKAGWFPFVEILGREFRALLDACVAGFGLVEAETALLAGFDNTRVDQIFSRWLAKPPFAVKKDILAPAIRAFKEKDAVVTLKILLTEIEGVLAEAYRARHGKTAKLSALLQFAAEAAEAKAGSSDTLLFPKAFATYLRDYTFSDFDRSAPSPADAGSRHAVGHGAAAAESYTQVRALQALLTLDQLAFYLN